MYNIDWERYKKNLKLEREAWSKYEIKRDFLKQELANILENKREELEQTKLALEEEFKKQKIELKMAYHLKEKSLLKKYQQEVEKKFKPSVE